MAGESETIRKRSAADICDNLGIEKNNLQSRKKSKVSRNSSTGLDKYLNKNESDVGSELLVVNKTKNTNESNKGIWETFSDKALYVYTSKGCDGRSKVIFIVLLKVHFLHLNS